MRRGQRPARGLEGLGLHKERRGKALAEAGGRCPGVARGKDLECPSSGCKAQDPKVLAALGRGSD